MTDCSRKVPYTQPQPLQISWLHCIALSLNLPSRFPGKCQESALCFLLSLFQIVFIPPSSPIHTRSMLGAVKFHSNRGNTPCAVHSCCALLNIHFKSCTTGQLQLPPCLYVLVSFGIDKTLTDTWWNSV